MEAEDGTRARKIACTIGRHRKLLCTNGLTFPGFLAKTELSCPLFSSGPRYAYPQRTRHSR